MFAELSITSNFTFLTGGAHPEEYIRRAAILGIGAIAVADENSVAGIVRAHTEARELARIVALRRAADADPIGPPRPDHVPAPPSVDIYCVPRLIPAARIVLEDGFTATAIPRDRKGWGNLCRLISVGRLRADKGACHLRFDDLLEWGDRLHLLLTPVQYAPTGPRGARIWEQRAQQLARRFPGHVALMMSPQYDGYDTRRFDSWAALAADLGLPTVAAAAPVMHHGARRRLTDVLNAIRMQPR